MLPTFSFNHFIFISNNSSCNFLFVSLLILSYTGPSLGLLIIPITAKWTPPKAQEGDSHQMGLQALPLRPNSIRGPRGSFPWKPGNLLRPRWRPCLSLDPLWGWLPTSANVVASHLICQVCNSRIKGENG